MSATASRRSACFVGTVSHHRLSGPGHRFAYPAYLHLVDVDELPAVDAELWTFGHRRRRLVAFHDEDHFDATDDVRESLRRVVAAAGESWPGGRLEVLTQCRILGFVFNPVSFWFCYEPAGALALVVAEVNNTFGDRHPYVLPVRAADTRETPNGGTRYRWTSKKLMHVSPFFPLDGSYVWEFEQPGTRAWSRVDLTLRGQLQFTASFVGERRPLSDRSLLRLLVTFPLMTVKVIAAIHWEALKLRIKGAPFRSQPPYDPDAARHGVS